MNEASFNTDYLRMLRKLDKFFDNRLSKLNYEVDVEYEKENLLQDTALLCLEKLRQPGHVSYSNNKAIWLKANDAWSNFVRQNKQRIVVIGDIEDYLDHHHDATSPQSVLESKDTLERVQKWVQTSHHSNFELFSQYHKGYTYAELAEEHEKSIAAVKQRLERLHAEMRKKL